METSFTVEVNLTFNPQLESILGKKYNKGSPQSPYFTIPNQVQYPLTDLQAESAQQNSSTLNSATPKTECPTTQVNNLTGQCSLEFTLPNETPKAQLLQPD